MQASSLGQNRPLLAVFEKQGNCVVPQDKAPPPPPPPPPKKKTYCLV